MLLFVFGCSARNAASAALAFFHTHNDIAIIFVCKNAENVSKTPEKVSHAVCVTIFKFDLHSRGKLAKI